MTTISQTAVPDTTETCGICIEKYNHSSRLKIKCEYCDYTACRKCCATYLLNETDAKCMNTAQCNKPWSRRFISTVMTKSFINNEFKTHREQIVYDIERSFLPATQEIIERQKEMEKIDVEIHKYYEMIDEIRAMISEKLKLRERIRTQNNANSTPQERSSFIRGCPAEECRGFLSSQWKCGICDNWSCPQCHVVKGRDRNAEHVCNENDLKTAALITRDTKSCPKCAVLISKIDGCDQMFCVNCNTSFSWKTGAIATTNIHNPHYFEWIRRTGGNIREGGGGDPGAGCRFNHRTYFFILNGVVRHYIKNKYLTDHQIMSMKHTPDQNIPKNIMDTVNTIELIIRNALHISDVVIPRYNAELLNTPEAEFQKNKCIRIQYLKNYISEANYKTQLQRKDKKIQKYREIANILQTVYDATVDIILRIHSEIKSVWTPATTFQKMEEMTGLIKYANDCFADVGKTFNSRVLVLNEKLLLT